MLDSYEEGMTVLFGEYEQDGNVFNGMEPIEWRILDIVDGKALLMSVYSLEKVPYNSAVPRGITWEDASLNTWLRESFYEQAFTVYQKMSIVSMPENAVNTDGLTNDYTDSFVSILSDLQISKYLPKMDDRVCYPTKHSSQGGGKTQNGASMWFTWKPGEITPYGRYVTSTGSVYLAGENQKTILVRPCIWVKLP